MKYNYTSLVKTHHKFSPNKSLVKHCNNLLDNKLEYSLQKQKKKHNINLACEYLLPYVKFNF